MRRRRTGDARRNHVARRASYCCEYCRSQAAFSPAPFSVEHILPQVAGGTHAEENLAYSCQGCNNHKYSHTDGFDPVTGELVPLFHPREQRWDQHFAWSADYTLIHGLTPTGRATIDRLQLNRSNVVNLRRVVLETGDHPPSAPEDGPVLLPDG